MSIEVEHIEVSLDSVMNYFEKGFKTLDPQTEIMSIEHFIDFRKGVVVFKITMGDK